MAEPAPGKCESLVRTDSARLRVSSAITLLLLAGAFGALSCGKDTPTSPSTPATTTITTTTTTASDPPTVSAISPSSGGDIGGTTVTITGTNFAAGAGVLIGGVPASNVVVTSDTTITATTGAHDAAVVDIQVTVGSQSGKLEGGFTYLGPVETIMTFTVYNHTAGRLGQWTASAQSGTSMTIKIGSLGQVLDANGNLVQAAVPVDSADASRLVLRAAGVNGRTGDFVGWNKLGEITFGVPYVARQAYDVFVMNAANGTDYSLVDQTSLTYSRETTVSRGPDTGGGTGPDSLIDAFVRELDLALVQPWMRYGQVARADAGGEIVITYTSPNAGTCMTYTRATGKLFINPDLCAAASVDMDEMSLEKGFEMFVGLRNVFGSSTSPAIDANTRQVTAAGRDLLAYVYLKDGRNW